MALIVITIMDNEAGDADVAVQCEPKLEVGDPSKVLSAAQLVALNMLHAACDNKDTPIKEDRGLIQLLN